MVASVLEARVPRIWTVPQMGLLSLLAGPLVGLFCMYRNYRAFGHDVLAKKTVWMGCLFLLFAITFSYQLLVMMGRASEELLFVTADFCCLASWYILYEVMERLQLSMVHEYLEFGRKQTRRSVTLLALFFIAGQSLLILCAVRALS